MHTARKFGKCLLLPIGLFICSIALVHSSVAMGYLGVRSGDQWSDAELHILGSLQISRLGAVPSDPSNPFENSAKAVAFGKRLFGDARFSSNGVISCASCHNPRQQFQDGAPLGRGIGVGKRRSISLVGEGHGPWYSWDGHKDSLWSQALGPLEDPLAHGGDRLAYVHLLQRQYRNDYEAIFGQMPDFRALPENAGPYSDSTGRSRWSELQPIEREQVSRVFANMGKALAAYVKTLQYGESRVDRYISGVLQGDAIKMMQLSTAEKNGLRVFIGKGLCASCHNGPLFTDYQFHNVGISSTDVGIADSGRAEGVAKLLQDEFNCAGPYSGTPASQCRELKFAITNKVILAGAFKTPSLRNVALRPPYMHNGQIGTLKEVVTHYTLMPRIDNGHDERSAVALSDQEIDDVVAFLGSLSGPVLEGSNNK